MPVSKTDEAELPCDRAWSTQGLLADAKMASWNGIVAEYMTELAVDAEDPRQFNATWRQFSLSAVELNCISATPQRVFRTSQMVDRSVEPTYELVHMHRGSMVVQEGQRRDLIRQGDFALLQNHVPYDFQCAGDSLAFSLHFDDGWLRQWVAHPERLRELPFELRRNWGSPLASLLHAIARNGLAETTVPRDTLADQLGSLLSLIGGYSQNFRARRTRSTLDRVRDLMAQRFREAELTPSMLAKDAGISKRHLHGLFASVGTTFGAELIELRLQQAARILSDRRACEWQVSEIAFGVGFSDSSHFARRFKSRFGCSPSGWRK